MTKAKLYKCVYFKLYYHVSLDSALCDYEDLFVVEMVVQGNYIYWEMVITGAGE